MRIKEFITICLLLVSVSLFAQEKIFEVTGVVTDTNKEPLVGVNVTVKDKPGLGAITDINGRYKIKIEEFSRLVFSYIGFDTQEVLVKRQNLVNVSMKESDAREIDEVVITGTGAQKKLTVTGAVTNVDVEVLKSNPSANLSNALAGNVPGVLAMQTSGQPGVNTSEFWIRGISTFGANSAALVLVDGFERDLDEINIEDIESFTVLKDASTTAIYGPRGANGVVLITTKHGKEGKIKINAKVETSYNARTITPEFADGYTYAMLMNEARITRNQERMYQDDEMEILRLGLDQDLYPNVDWMDVLLKDGAMTYRANLNMSGGGSTARYFVSLSYVNEEGMYKTDEAMRKDYNTNPSSQRWNYRLNTDIDITKSTLVKVGVSGSLKKRNAQGQGSNVWTSLMGQSPISIPVMYSNGYIPSHGTDDNRNNPWVLATQSGYKEIWNNKIQTNISLEQKLDFITKGLSVRLNASYDYDSEMIVRREYNPTRYHATGRDENGNLLFATVVSGNPELQDPKNSATSATKKIYIDAAINYKRTFDQHEVGAMLLYMQKETQYHNVALPYRKQGLVGRLTYGYGGRYFIEGNFGYTGSEAFASGNRFGFFPAVGLAYYISNESFYPEVIKKYVPKLKLRASVGRAGNDNTGGTRFLYRPTYKMDAGGFTQGYNDTGGGLNGIGNGIIEGRFAAPYLGWEVEDKQNYGFDIGLFDNRLEVIFDYFDSTRSQILLQRQTVPQLGGLRDDPWQNFGKVRNRGVDMSVNAHQNIGKVKLSARGTFTFTRNKILEYDELPPKYDYQAITGKRVSDKDNLYYIAERLYTEDAFTVSTNANGLKTYKLRSEIPQPTLGGLLGPGDIKYTDVNGDGIIDSYDRVRGIGHPETPEIIYGFGLNAEYKGIYASIFFQGAGNTSVLLGGKTSEGWYPFSWGVDQSNYRTFALNRWTENNPSQDVIIPRLHKSNANNANNRVASTWWLRDGSFLRLKNIEIGYQIPKKFLSKIGFEAARIYLMGYNLAVWDHIKYFDPEAGNANAGLNYPLPRTYTIGLDFTF